MFGFYSNFFMWSCGDSQIIFKNVIFVQLIMFRGNLGVFFGVLGLKGLRV